MQVLVTGASGFVGGALIQALVDTGRFSVRASLRRPGQSLPSGIQSVVSGDTGPETDWSEALSGVQVLVHTAALAHVTGDHLTEALQRTNVDATLNLASQAAAAGVRRFIFLSTVGVHGDGKTARRLTESSPVDPHTPYAHSKFRAEEGLREICADTGMEWLILRCPLIYGTGAPGNFRQLLRWVSRGWPLPLGAVDNHRSLLALDNLLDLLLRCVDHPAAANHVFLVADNDSVSTPELVRLLAQGANQPARLLSVPNWLLRMALLMTGRGGMYQQLCGSLEVDTTAVRKSLNWQPPLSPAKALPAAAAAYQRDYPGASRQASAQQ